MMWGLAVAVNLLLVRRVRSSCSCSPSPSSGLSVNCSSQDLSRLPDFPSDTTELHLQHNRLLTVPPGFFEVFINLRVVNLSGNPFHCGCNIRYLRSWLLKNPDVSVERPTCSTPPSLVYRTVAGLDDAELSSCVRNRCPAAGYNLALALALCGVLGLLLWSFLLVKDLSFTLGIGEKHGGLRAESLRSLKPKHRTRVNNFTQGNKDLQTSPLDMETSPLDMETSPLDMETSPLDMETSPLDMDILPQIIDTLHKRHNINIKNI